MLKILKGALTGALAGAIAGPVIVGLLGFILLAVTWLIQVFIQQRPAEELTGAVVHAAAFGLLIAPFGASTGCIVGLIIGAFNRWFGSRVNAGSFGGFIGAVVGAVVGLTIFTTGDLAPLIVSVVAMAATGVLVAIIVKGLQRWLKQERGGKLEIRN